MTVAVTEDVIDAVQDDLLDVLTSRPQLMGAYICLESSSSSRYISDRRVATALLELSYHLGDGAGLEVAVNFADLFGLVCMGVGATHFATGYSQKDRQLNLADFEETGGGGGAYPRFLSLRGCARFRVGRELEAIRDQRLLGRLNEDRTASSGPLLDALEAGATASQVPGWEENRNNDLRARAHLNELLARASDAVSGLEGTTARAAATFLWLQDADLLVSYFQRRFSDTPFDEMGAWTSAWRSAFEDFATGYGLL